MLRADAERRRQEHLDRDTGSATILKNIRQMGEYADAQTVLTFVGFGTEVDTRPLLETLKQDSKTTVVPYCQHNDLHLFRLLEFTDLAPGIWGILEPKTALWALSSHAITVGEIDLFLVPGLAFDRRGGRLGYGKGYFDRLLTRAREDATIVGVGFNCQMFDEVPMLPHDVRMQWIVTESGVHHCDGNA